MTSSTISNYTSTAPVRVMIVDDSPIIRSLITHIFNKIPGIILSASAADGSQALEIIQRQSIDIVLLDIDMPGMNGFTALPLLLKASPKSRIILIADALTTSADTGAKALALGASGFIQKPIDAQNAVIFEDALVEKIFSLAPNASDIANNKKASPSQYSQPPLKESPTIQLRPQQNLFTPNAIAIGSSTGGPEALVRLFKQLAGQIKYTPIFITQHMPASFTSLLATHIQEVSKTTCIEPKDGESVMPGSIYLAPGDFHMEFRQHDNKNISIHLTKDPPENFCRPSVNPMLRSLVKIYGKHILTIILTGMGQDGLEGCKSVSEAGGIVLAQDQTSSVVWGMPGSVATQGLCNAVLPLDGIASYIRNIMGCKL